MSSIDIHTNGNGDAYDRILRPRAIKPSNPAVLRAMVNDKFAPNGNQELPETRISTGQTRYVA